MGAAASVDGEGAENAPLHDLLKQEGTKPLDTSDLDDDSVRIELRRLREITQRLLIAESSSDSTDLAKALEGILLKSNQGGAISLPTQTHEEYGCRCSLPIRGGDVSAEGKRARLAAASPLMLSSMLNAEEIDSPLSGRTLEDGTTAADLEGVVRVYVSDELSKASDDDGSGTPRAFSGQVSIGGRVYFVIFRGSSTEQHVHKERVCVVKFCKSGSETASEHFANYVASRCGIQLPSVMLLRKGAGCSKVGDNAPPDMTLFVAPTETKTAVAAADENETTKKYDPTPLYPEVASGVEYGEGWYQNFEVSVAERLAYVQSKVKAEERGEEATAEAAKSRGDEAAMNKYPECPELPQASQRQHHAISMHAARAELAPLALLAEDLSRSPCFLLQEFVAGSSFQSEEMLRTKFSELREPEQEQQQQQTNECKREAAQDQEQQEECDGAALGAVFVCDLLLRNSDRLADTTLQWRGNLTNLLLSSPPPPPPPRQSNLQLDRHPPPSSTVATAPTPTSKDNEKGAPRNTSCSFQQPESSRVWAIDTTLPRRPPRLALRGDLTKLPHSIDQVLALEEKHGTSEEGEGVEGTLLSGIMEAGSGSRSLSALPPPVPSASSMTKILSLIGHPATEFAQCALFCAGFQRGVVRCLEDVALGLLPALEERHAMLQSLFNSFFLKAHAIDPTSSSNCAATTFGGSSISKNKNGKASSSGTGKSGLLAPERPNTARVRHVKRVANSAAGVKEVAIDPIMTTAAVSNRSPPETVSKEEAVMFCAQFSMSDDLWELQDEARRRGLVEKGTKRQVLQRVLKAQKEEEDKEKTQEKNVEAQGEVSGGVDGDQGGNGASGADIADQEEVAAFNALFEEQELLQQKANGAAATSVVSRPGGEIPKKSTSESQEEQAVRKSTDEAATTSRAMSALVVAFGRDLAAALKAEQASLLQRHRKAGLATALSAPISASSPTSVSSEKEPSSNSSGAHDLILTRRRPCVRVRSAFTEHVLFTTQPSTTDGSGEEESASSSSALFASAYEEMVRLEHMLLRGKLLHEAHVKYCARSAIDLEVVGAPENEQMAASLQVLLSPSVATSVTVDEVLANYHPLSVLSPCSVNRSQMAPPNQSPKGRISPKNPPRVFRTHPLGATASLSAITSRLEQNTPP